MGYGLIGRRGGCRSLSNPHAEPSAQLVGGIRSERERDGRWEMGKVTRKGDRTLDPKATPADRIEGPALDRAEIQLRLRRDPLPAIAAAAVVTSAAAAPPSSTGALRKAPK